MDHTTAGGTRGARGIIAASTITFVAGITTTATGLAAGDTARSASGASIIIIALATLSLIVLHRWVTDTSAERTRLSAAETAARNEQARYIAGLAAVDAERARLRRDATAMARRQLAQLEADREKLRDEFEDERERISTEAFRTGALMERAGLLKEPQPASVTHLYARRERAAFPGDHISQRPS